MTSHAIPATYRSVTVPDDLGAVGLGFAADVLEHAADGLTAFPAHMQSLQEVADWLRATAVAVPEAAP